VIVAVTGFATFVLEIVWMRLLALIIGPSIYAFSATVAMFITAIAAGGLLGEAWLQRTRRHRLALAMALALAAAGGFTMWAASYAGSSLPHQIASGRANWLQTVPADAIVLRFLLAASTVAPGALALGVVFPLAIEMAGGRTAAAASRIARIYGVNAVASFAGAMAASFSLIPLAGLEPTIRIASGTLVCGALVFVFRSDPSRLERIAIVAAVTGSVAAFVSAPRWDHELLASGLYRADHRQPWIEEESGLASLQAGTLLYYREGSTGTVSVKQLNGTLSLAIDGKVDASTSGDMLTQKLLAHLPLLMHERPRTVGIIGLGSGVTLASALVHPVARVDVVELSPEVVEASSYFAKVNAGALSEPRARLIVGDGRTHLLLTQQRYDVIVSEPSNPWMAGVAGLFTREFFQAARNRLAPGGILCQWTHTYSMTDRDLRSIIATFLSVFPRGMMWRIGDGDLLLVASPDRELPLAHIEAAWHRPRVAMDLATVSAHEPFSVLSMFGGGTAYLQTLAQGAELQTDDRLALEFSGPLAVLGNKAPDSRHALTRTRSVEPLPPPIAHAMASAGADEWQRRGAMMRDAEAHETAYEDFARAIAIEPSNTAALDGLVEAAIATSKGGGAERVLRSASTARPHDSAPWIALSRLQASLGRFDEAIESAMTGYKITSRSPEALEQLASVHADLGDAPRLIPIVGLLQRLFPDRRGTYYYTAAAEFLTGRLEPALRAIDRAIAIDPAYAQAHNLRGAVQARLGRVEDAKAAFAVGLALNPRDSAIYNNYGLLELELGNRDAAAGLFQEALAIDPASQVSRRGLIEARLTSR
jgi:spermidine synthase